MCSRLTLRVRRPMWILVGFGVGLRWRRGGGAGLLRGDRERDLDLSSIHADNNDNAVITIKEVDHGCCVETLGNFDCILMFTGCVQKLKVVFHDFPGPFYARFPSLSRTV